MELSKEEIKLLKLAKDNKISLDQNMYYDNQILQDLLNNKKLIVATAEYKHSEYFPTKYELTVNGQNELSKYKQSRYDFWKAHLYLPVASSTVVGIFTYIAGYLVGKFGH